MTIGSLYGNSRIILDKSRYYYWGKANKIKKNPQGHFLKSKVCGPEVRVSPRKSNWRASYLTCVPFITTGVVSLKIHFQPSVYVCALYIPPCQTCCYAKANLLDSSPIREKKLRKRENFRSPLDARHFCCSCCAPLNCLDRHKVDACIFYIFLQFLSFFLEI